MLAISIFQSILSKNVSVLGIAIILIVYIIEMLPKGYGNVEERPKAIGNDYTKKEVKDNYISQTSIFFIPFLLISRFKPRGLGQSPIYFIIIFFLQG